MRTKEETTIILFEIKTQYFNVTENKLVGCHHRHHLPLELELLESLLKYQLDANKCTINTYIHRYILVLTNNDSLGLH